MRVRKLEAIEVGIRAVMVQGNEPHRPRKTRIASRPSIPAYEAWMIFMVTFMWFPPEGGKFRLASSLASLNLSHCAEDNPDRE
jgi:hypothetical protein